MDIEKAAADLNKKIEKLERVLKDGTPLTPAQQQAKVGEVARLRAQIQSLQQHLKPIGVTKVVHKN